MLPRLKQDTDKMTILNPFNVILTDQSIRHTTDSWYQMNNEANVYQHCKLKCDTGSQISQSYSGKNSVVSLRPVCWAAAGAVARTEEWSDKNWTQVHSTKTLVSGPGLPLPAPTPHPPQCPLYTLGWGHRGHQPQANMNTAEGRSLNRRTWNMNTLLLKQCRAFTDLAKEDKVWIEQVE